ncbi:VF530 family protein [bacterium]|nr:VF530 family protein [bacterium]
MSDLQPNNPLHGIKLEQVITQLQDHFGWDGLADRININCFKSNPSVKSSLKFLRRTLWAREKVEALYIDNFSQHQPPKNSTSSSDPWANRRNKKS